MTDIQKIEDAWQKEASLGRQGLRPAADPTILSAIIPAGGDWACVTPAGAITRSITWMGKEVCLVNPAGHLPDELEAAIAMGLRATPALDKAMRAIFVLADDPANLDLIKRMARAAIVYVELPAPPISKTEV